MRVCAPFCFFPRFVHSRPRVTAQHVTLFSHKHNINDTNAPQRCGSPQRLELLQALHDALVGVGCAGRCQGCSHVTALEAKDVVT